MWPWQLTEVEALKQTGNKQTKTKEKNYKTDKSA